MRALPEFVTIQNDWLSTEAKYKNQQNVIAQAQTSLSSAWMSYQQSSSIIYAPISGVVNGLSLQTGAVLNTQSNSSGNFISQKIASIITSANPTVQLNLTEIDVTKVKIGNKATLTFDAFSGKTFTGQIISIDTAGTVSSGVTTYPTVIKLDTIVDGLYTNMSAQANIMIQIKNDVLLVPSGAVQTQNGQSTVRVMKDGNVSSISVETGTTNGTQTEIVSGLSEGDIVITGQTSTANTAGASSTSLFGNTNTRGGFGGLGGGATVIRR
jgi:macrolide-specific efflux system membrane fusion protein